jgi:hypothetical protein
VSLKQWKCHKTVTAGEITSIKERPDGTAVLSMEDSHVGVDPDYMLRCKPRVGGYFVRYKDGYESFSPPDPFLEGYTPIDQEEA